MRPSEGPNLPDLLCDFPLTSEIFSVATHPTEPVISVGLAKGHVTTIRLPPSDQWAGQQTNGSSITSSALKPARKDSVAEEPLKKAKKRVSISNKILTSTPSSNKPSSVLTSRLKVVSRPRNLVDILWQTKRHKVSCRDIAFSSTGDLLFSGGGDSILKACNPETGRVITKIMLPPADSSSSKPDVPFVLRTLSPQTLLIGTESAAVHVLDLRCHPTGTARAGKGDGSTTVFDTIRLDATYNSHPKDFVSSISLVPPSSTSTSGFSKQWISSGGGTLVLTDLRKGVLVESENHYRDFLSSIVVSPYTNGSSVEKVIAASDFSSTVPIFNKSNLDAEIANLKCVDMEESIDAMTIAPQKFQSIESAGDGDVIACATSSGYVRFVATTHEARRRHGLSLGSPTISDIPHADMEAVNAVEFDVHGRMIVGGGHTLRIWSEHLARPREESGSESDEDVEDSDDDDDEAVGAEAPKSTTVIDQSIFDSDANGTLKRKRSVSKPFLSDAWKFNFVDGPGTIPEGDESEGGESKAVGAPKDDEEGEGEGEGENEIEAEDNVPADDSDSSDYEALAKTKKRKKGGNLPSGGAPVSFDGLD